MITHIEHITLTTGAARRSARSEVADHVIAALRAALAEKGGKMRDWTITLLAAPAGCHVYDLTWKSTLVARCWLCEDAAISKDVWTAAIQVAPPGTRLHPPASVPWLAAALAPTALDAGPEPVMMVGDLERCVAWAILE